MNFSWIKIIVMIVIIAVIAAIGYWAYEHFFVKPAQQEQTVQLTKAIQNNFLVTPVGKMTDSSGSKHNQYKGNQNTFYSSTISALKDTSLGGPDSAAKILKIQKDQIEHWQQVAATYQATALKAMRGVDSLGRMVRYYKGKYMDIIYHPPFSKDSTDNGTFDYKGHFNLTTTNYYKKKILGIKYDPMVDVSIDDPNTTINGYRTLTIAPPEQFFNIKAQVKATYDFGSGIFVPSAGVLISTGNFDFMGHGYYSQRFQKIEPLISVTYNVFSLHK